MTVPDDALLNAVQAAIDADGEGWRVAHYVLVVGLESLGADGMTTSAAVYFRPGQPDYITAGLLATAVDLAEED